MLISLRFMETHGVALGYVGDKIRYILIIRVRFTTEFFFEHGFIGFNGCLLRYRYCLPDSFTWCTYNPETSSRVTLASLGIVVQTTVTLS